MEKRKKSLVVVGGGAAGFFCAVNAARLAPGLQVTIVEKSSKVLQKVKVSGGSRCNLTHDCSSIVDMSKHYPRGEKFVKKAFYHFFVKDTISWFAERGVEVKAEADGRMFPISNISQTIMDCLLAEANKYKVELLLNFQVATISKNGSKWKIDSTTQRSIEADSLCIACGGFPKAEMFDWLLLPTGHTLVPPVPSLFTFNLPGHPITKLMGVSAPVQVKIAGMKWESAGPLLITHWGLSGPAVLRLSAFAARDLHALGYHFTAIINWLPGFNETSLREHIMLHRNEYGGRKVVSTDWIKLPQRLWEFLLQVCGIDPNLRWAELPAAKQNLLVKKLCAYDVQASGKTTFKDEFVTAGGIDTTEVNHDTMESRKIPHLYFAGEIMNVDGVTGGFNFQHAWSSGFIAAKAIAQNFTDND